MISGSAKSLTKRITPYLRWNHGNTLRSKQEEGGHSGSLSRLTIALFIAAIPVALIATNIRVAISEQKVYDYSVREHNAAEVSGIPKSELLRANGEIQAITWRMGDAEDHWRSRCENDRGATVPLFSARETAHMADVRDLVQTLFTVQMVSVLVVLTLAVMTIVIWPPRVLAMAALCGSLLTGGLLGTAGVVAASGFDSAWTEFHVVAFSNDLWHSTLREDHLIQMYPETFWFEITTLIVAGTLLGGGAYQRRVRVIPNALATAGGHADGTRRTRRGADQPGIHVRS